LRRPNAFEIRHYQRAKKESGLGAPESVRPDTLTQVEDLRCGYRV